MNKPVCVIVGVGSGNGASFSRKFSQQGYRVAMLARNLDYLKQLETEISDAYAYQYNVIDVEMASEVFSRIESDLGTISVLIYNAGAGAFSNIDQTTGNIVIIGATASVKGGANFVPFASAKAAQRSLAQSLARYLDPEKIHVSYIIVDGVIDSQRTRQAMLDKSDDYFMCSDDIADSVFFLTQQSPSAWTFELDLRPFAEKW